MTVKTLYVAQYGHGNKDGRDEWFPFGRLEADEDASKYRFQYTHGGWQAAKSGKFAPLPSFPDLERSYESSELFSFFANRAMDSRRPDFQEYIRTIGLGAYASPIDQIAANGGRKVTDHFEIFPAPVKDDDGYWVFRCFLDRCASADVIESLKMHDPLRLAISIDGKPDRVDVQAQTMNHLVVGWLPAYLAGEFAFTMVDIDHYQMSVSRVNPPPIPRSYRIQVDVRLKWKSRRAPLAWSEYMVMPGK